jgi:hypothetical protein
MVVLRNQEERIQMEIMNHRRPFIIEDSENGVRLISKVKDKQGRNTILCFSKNKEQTKKVVDALTKLIKRQIVTNFQMNMVKFVLETAKAMRNGDVMEKVEVLDAE